LALTTIALPDQVIPRLHHRAGAARWGLSESEFAAVLQRSAENRFKSGSDASPIAIEAFLESLKLEDLALAAACEQGKPEAWDYFVTQYRPVLYAAARVASRDESSAREIADSLYADLYGIRGSERSSLLRFFHGRSSLATWLRAIVAQRFVDSYRAARRDVALEKRLREEPDFATDARVDPPDPKKQHYLSLFSEVLPRVLNRIAPEERLRLSLYYLRNLTLAQISVLLGEHESTVWRRLKKTVDRIRSEVEKRLGKEHGLSSEEIQTCYEYTLATGSFDATELLVESGPGNPDARSVDQTVLNMKETS
jgi:RNA polymerase sigma-70 factor